jgi:hypothetical protein
MKKLEARRDFVKMIAGGPLKCMLTWSLLGKTLRAEASAAGPSNARDESFLPVVERWGIQEITLRTSKTYSNPFADVGVSCLFQCGSTKVTSEGFHDGGDTWKVRLMPPAEGQWSFETRSDDGELNGKRGVFQCSPAGPNNHGPVAVRNQYHLAYADGTPYYCLGTTLYNWVHREEKLQQETLAQLRNSPFNKVRFCVFPKWYAFNHVEPPRLPYRQADDGKFDFERFDPEYFRHIEQRLFDLNALGIQADLILFHPYDQWGFASMDSAHDDAYLRYLVARMAAFRNVWWTMANEWDFIKPAKNWDHIFQTIQRLDPYNHLRGIHNGRIWYDHGKPWVTHCEIQLQGGDTYATAVGARQEYGKPVCVEEYGYEGNNTKRWGDLSGREETERHWGIAMAGAYGSHGETYVQPGDILWWAVGGKLVGESPSRLAFLKQVMTEAPYEQMEPLAGITSQGTALGKKGAYYLFRFASLDWEEEVEIDLEGPQLYEVDLIDPWLMKVYHLGRTYGGKQSIVLHLAPCLLRLKGATQNATAASPSSIAQLLKQWEANPD